jgi:Tfp pilus assembly protein PilO
VGLHKKLSVGLSFISNLTLEGVAWFAQVSRLFVALLLAGTVLGLCFAFVHPDHIIALDDDDDQTRRVGDPPD